MLRDIQVHILGFLLVILKNEEVYISLFVKYIHTCKIKDILTLIKIMMTLLHNLTSKLPFPHTLNYNLML